MSSTKSTGVRRASASKHPKKPVRAKVPRLLSRDPTTTAETWLQFLSINHFRIEQLQTEALRELANGPKPEVESKVSAELPPTISVEWTRAENGLHYIVVVRDQGVDAQGRQAEFRFTSVTYAIKFVYKYYKCTSIQAAAERVIVSFIDALFTEVGLL